MSRYGLKTYTKLTFQNTFGLAQTTSSQSIPLVAENLTKNINPISKKGLKGRFVKSKFTDGKKDISGGLDFEASAVALSFCFKAVLGHKLSQSSGGIFTHEFDVSTDDYSDLSAVNPMTVELNKDDDTNSVYFQDMLGSGLVVDITNGSLVTCKLDLLGVGKSEDTKSATNFLYEKPFKWSQSSISLDGETDLDFENISLAVNNNLESRYTLQNTDTARKIKRTEEVGLELSGSVILENTSWSAMFDEQTEHVFNANLKNTDGDVLNISIPNLRIREYNDNQQAPGLIMANFIGEAFYNQGSESAILVTVTNSYPLYISPFILDDPFYGLLDQDYNFLT